MVFHSLLVNLTTIQTMVNGTPKKIAMRYSKLPRLIKKATHCSLNKPILAFKT